MDVANAKQEKQRILKWKALRRALIIAHNYQPEEIQELADYTGDSLELARLAAQTDAEVIACAGVIFMAESAKILSPQKTVLLPVPEAGCPLADTITAEDLRRARQQHPQAAVVVYVNSPAEVKALADVCCTSANAIAVVNAVPQAEVILAPDKNLADWVARHTEKRVIPWPGSCCTHNAVRLEAVEAARKAHPQASVLVHPECRPEVCARADAVLSTSQMLRQARADANLEFIIGTEIGLLYRLRKENPEKLFYPLSEGMVCASMKLTTLRHLGDALEFMPQKVEVPEEVRSRAFQALEAMLRIQ
ncbi:quinolinate synthase NadA [candidate division FCPU426 bacterium]|nr:quinolinate synthase NadA [candidate division FCPU426 bacterium]